MVEGLRSRYKYGAGRACQEGRDASRGRKRVRRLAIDPLNPLVRGLSDGSEAQRAPHDARREARRHARHEHDRHRPCSDRTQHVGDPTRRGRPLRAVPDRQGRRLRARRLARRAPACRRGRGDARGLLAAAGDRDGRSRERRDADPRADACHRDRARGRARASHARRAAASRRARRSESRRARGVRAGDRRHAAGPSRDRCRHEPRRRASRRGRAHPACDP